MIIIAPICYPGEQLLLPNPGTYVEGQAGELAAVAAGDEGGEEDHQQHVTTAPCSVVTLDGAVPAAVRRPQALGLTHYVVPQHLRAEGEAGSIGEAFRARGRCS